MSDKYKGESEVWVMNIKRDWRLIDESKGEIEGWVINLKERVKVEW